MKMPGLALAILSKGRPTNGKRKRDDDDDDEREALAMQVAQDFRQAMDSRDDRMILESMRAMVDLSSMGDDDDN